MAKGDIEISIDANAAGAIKGFRETQTSAQKAAKSINAGAKIAALGFAAAGAAGLMMAKNAAEDAAGARRLAVALKNTTGATTKQTNAVENWISKQGTALGVSDDQLRPSLQRLAQATHDVTKAQQLASLAMDVSAGSGQSLESVSKLIAKAQSGQVTGLAKLGIQTKQTVKDTAATKSASLAAQKAQLAYNDAVAKSGAGSSQAQKAHLALVAANDKLDAAQKKTKTSALSFDQIVKNMSQTFKGQASAAANSADGKLARFKLTVDEAQESIGYLLLPALTAVASFMTAKLIPAINTSVNWLSQHKTIAAILAGVVGVLGGAFIATAAAMKAYAAIQAFSTEGTVANTLVTKTAAVATKAWAATQWLLNAAMSANPIALVVIAVAALVAGIVIAWKQSATFRAVVTGAFGAVKNAAVTAFGWVKSNWPLLLGILTGPIGLAVLAITKNWDKITGSLSKVKGKIASISSGMWDGIKDAFRAAINYILRGWNSIHLTLPKVDTHIPGVGKVGGFTLQVPQIPLLDTGGVVKGPGLVRVGPIMERMTPVDVISRGADDTQDDFDLLAKKLDELVDAVRESSPPEPDYNRFARAVADQMPKKLAIGAREVAVWWAEGRSQYGKYA